MPGVPPVAIRDETGLSSGAETHSVTILPKNILHIRRSVFVTARTSSVSFLRWKNDDSIGGAMASASSLGKNTEILRNVLKIIQNIKK